MEQAVDTYPDCRLLPQQDNSSSSPRGQVPAVNSSPPTSPWPETAPGQGRPLSPFDRLRQQQEQQQQEQQQSPGTPPPAARHQVHFVRLQPIPENVQQATRTHSPLQPSNLSQLQQQQQQGWHRPFVQQRQQQERIQSPVGQRLLPAAQLLPCQRPLQQQQTAGGMQSPRSPDGQQQQQQQGLSLKDLENALSTVQHNARKMQVAMTTARGIGQTLIQQSQQRTNAHKIAQAQQSAAAVIQKAELAAAAAAATGVQYGARATLSATSTPFKSTAADTAASSSAANHESRRMAAAAAATCSYSWPVAAAPAGAYDQGICSSNITPEQLTSQCLPTSSSAVVTTQDERLLDTARYAYRSAHTAIHDDCYTDDRYTDAAEHSMDTFCTWQQQQQKQQQQQHKLAAGDDLNSTSFKFWTSTTAAAAANVFASSSAARAPAVTAAQPYHNSYKEDSLQLQMPHQAAEGMPPAAAAAAAATGHDDKYLHDEYLQLHVRVSDQEAVVTPVPTLSQANAVSSLQDYCTVSDGSLLMQWPTSSGEVSNPDVALSRPGSSTVQMSQQQQQQMTAAAFPHLGSQGYQQQQQQRQQPGQQLQQRQQWQQPGQQLQQLLYSAHSQQSSEHPSHWSPALAAAVAAAASEVATSAAAEAAAAAHQQRDLMRRYICDQQHEQQRVALLLQQQQVGVSACPPDDVPVEVERSKNSATVVAGKLLRGLLPHMMKAPGAHLTASYDAAAKATSGSSLPAEQASQFSVVTTGPNQAAAAASGATGGSCEKPHPTAAIDSHPDTGSISSSSSDDWASNVAMRPHAGAGRQLQRMNAARYSRS